MHTHTDQFIQMYFSVRAHFLLFILFYVEHKEAEKQSQGKVASSAQSLQRGEFFKNKKDTIIIMI